MIDYFVRIIKCCYILEIKMYSDEQKKVALQLRMDGNTYEEIGKILGFTKDVARQLCRYKKGISLRKRGPKFKIDSKSKLRIKRTIATFQSNKEKVNCSKILRSIEINVSKSTLQRYMKRSLMKYKNVKRKIFLTKPHKEERINTITEWFSTNQNWQMTSFSDEKKFNLDGPDNWCTYMSEKDEYFRESRQCKGGGIMVWLMVMPNGMLAHRIIEGKFKAINYIQLLQESVVPILKLNYGNNACYQDDNCSVHRARIVKQFMDSTGIKTLKWPSKSPDINLTEDAWKIISDRVYDGPQFQSKSLLSKKVNEVISTINQSERDQIRGLFNKYVKRLCQVLRKNGNLFNK